MGPPRLVGNYTLYEPIASGGMASVHLGRRNGTRGAEGVVAIKRMHETYGDDPDFVAMFLDEARIASRIRHPNVVSVHEVFSSAGALYMVMDFVHGLSLSALLKRERKRQPPSIAVLCSVMAGALRGLHAAHQATDERGNPLLIVHRDVSPQNILLGVDGVARVIDFGIAKAEGNAHRTRTGTVKGKLQYLSPEQLRRKEVTRQADIYAASAVLWEALTGRPLVNGGTEAELLVQLLNLEPPPPSSLNPAIPPVLDQVVLRGLARDPQQRFPSAAAMADAIERTAPPALPGAVQAWMLGLAADVVEAQSQRLFEAQTDTGLALSLPPPSAGAAPAALVAPASSGRLPLAGQPPPAAPSSAPALTSPALTSPALASPALASPAFSERPEPPRMLVVLASVAATLLVLGLVALLIPRQEAAPQASSAPPPPSASAQPAPSASSAASALPLTALPLVVEAPQPQPRNTKKKGSPPPTPAPQPAPAPTPRANPLDDNK